MKISHVRYASDVSQHRNYKDERERTETINSEVVVRPMTDEERKKFENAPVQKKNGVKMMTKMAFMTLRKQGLTIAKISEQENVSLNLLYKLVKDWGLVGWRPGIDEPSQHSDEDTQHKDEIRQHKDEIRQHKDTEEDKPDHIADVRKMVDHPPHYTAGGVECFDAIMSAVNGLPPDEAVCVGNIFKYVWRYRRKNGIEDLYKAMWFLDKLSKLVRDR
jgi:transposase